MEKVIYQTRPRLFIVCITFLGFIFFGFMFLLTVKESINDLNIYISFLLFGFLVLSLTSLFYFLKIKTIKLTEDNIIVSYYFLPVKKELKFNQILRIEQAKKEIKAMYGVSWKPSYIYTDITTLINLKGGQIIKLNSIGQLDFNEFYQTYIKLKRGEGRIKKQKSYFLVYFIDNFDGLCWIIIFLFLTIGLVFGVISTMLK